MNDLSYEQSVSLHQYLHPEKMYPMIGEAVIAAIYGTPLEIYRQIKEAFAAAACRAAEELLSQSDFAARVDRLPFTSGSTVVGLGDSITDDLQSWLEILRCLVSMRRPQDNI